MIIQILSYLKDDGYLNKGRHPTVAPFFAGANAAFRRQALQEIGGFDRRCVTGEDCDVCAQLSAAGKELYMQRRAVVAHNNPSTFKHLVRQWYGYGLYHPYVFRKHNEPAVEIHVRLGLSVAGERYTCLLFRKSPLALIVFVTGFQIMHLALLCAIGALVAGLTATAWVSAAVAGILFLGYAWRDLLAHGVFLGGTFTALRYAADMALFVGALIGGLRQRMLYLSATVD
jgi:cellulose synthase/poly-beta-1,6-N-acetylglucosamine synthase-like glycosyltransferase